MIRPDGGQLDDSLDDDDHDGGGGGGGGHDGGGCDDGGHDDESRCSGTQLDEVMVMMMKKEQHHCIVVYLRNRSCTIHVISKSLISANDLKSWWRWITLWKINWSLNERNICMFCGGWGGGQLLLSLSWAIFPQFYADEGRKTQHMMLSALHDIAELHCTVQYVYLSVSSRCIK